MWEAGEAGLEVNGSVFIGLKQNVSKFDWYYCCALQAAIRLYLFNYMRISLHTQNVCEIRETALF